MRTLRSVRRAFREWALPVSAAFFCLLAVKALVVEAFTIPTSSMESTLLVGDFLLVNKLLYGAELPGTDVRLSPVREPRRGEVVVFRPPHDPDRSYVKRIVGVEGDTLSMRHKVLYLNGDPQEEPYVRHSQRRGDTVHPRMRWQFHHLAAAGRSPGHYLPSRDNWGPLVVPPDRYFVLGDNRDNSEDSRYWGFVPRDDVLGHPWLIYFSLRHGSGQGPGSFLGKVRWGRLGRPVR